MTAKGRLLATAMDRACPVYAEARGDYERAVAAGNDPAIEKAWRRLQELVAAFNHGAEAALKERA